MGPIRCEIASLRNKKVWSGNATFTANQCMAPRGGDISTLTSKYTELEVKFIRKMTGKLEKIQRTNQKKNRTKHKAPTH